MNNSYDVIIVGAGAAGFSAAYHLKDTNKKILMLEAAQRIGGRINTAVTDGFYNETEAGAEFIHGNLPVTISLLNQAGISFIKIEGKSYKLTKGKKIKADEFIKDWDKLMKKLNSLEEDMSITSFLNNYFTGDTYKELRAETIRFVKGYDLADPDKASAIALRDEWNADDEEHQYRIDGGYIKLLQWLHTSSVNVKLQVNEPVTAIDIVEDTATVTTSIKIYKAQVVIITTSLGVLQLLPQHAQAIKFSNKLNTHLKALSSMGFGSVVKVIIHFKYNFWQDAFKNMGFIFSDAEVPTWWSQLPNEQPVLTGWLGGTSSELNKLSKKDIYTKAITSLAYIFDKSASLIKDMIDAIVITNWSNIEFIHGAYSFSTLQTKQALQILSSSINNKIFFAGEAIYNGEHPGTVEAALVSGKQAAEKIIFLNL